MKLYKIETGDFMLDGGAMFGVVPKALWNKVYPADENNMCRLSMRCLLIDTGQRRILIDTGIGDKQSKKFFSYYYLSGDQSLSGSLQKHGFEKKDITDVILTHLHFDHAGGAVEKDGENYKTAFPNATYWVSSSQWAWAMNPNQREKASFLPENYKAIEQNGQLRFVDRETVFTHDIQLRLFNGHTEGLIVPYIACNNHTLVYTSDLLPTAAHIPASWICGYDTRPLISMEEREKFLSQAQRNKYALFFEHDVFYECCTVKENVKGYCLDEAFTLNDFLKNKN